MESLKSCYASLGLTPGASRDDIRRAYRALAKMWHPDRYATDVTQPQDALDHFRRLTEAYQTLRREGAIREITPPVTSGVWRCHQALRWSLGALGLGLGGFFTLSLWLCSPRPSPGTWPPVLLSAPSILTASPSPRHYITVGSTPEEVRAIQGAPTQATARLWEYRGSRLYLRDGRVTGWDIWPTAPLQVHLLPTVQLVPRPASFSRGSTKDAVLTVQGTPTRLTEHVWEYGASRVFFTDNRVSKWDEWPGAPLMTQERGATSAP